MSEEWYDTGEEPTGKDEIILEYVRAKKCTTYQEVYGFLHKIGMQCHVVLTRLTRLSNAGYLERKVVEKDGRKESLWCAKNLKKRLEEDE